MFQNLLMQSLLFNSNASKEIFLKRFLSITIFEDFQSMRKTGFYKRYIYGVELRLTYINKCQFTDNEIIKGLVKRDAYYLMVSRF